MALLGLQELVRRPADDEGVSVFPSRHLPRRGGVRSRTAAGHRPSPPAVRKADGTALDGRRPGLEAADVLLVGLLGEELLVTRRLVVPLTLERLHLLDERA